YNDIGVYLMQQEKLDEAIPWLEKAKKAKRYEPRHFPYINLGRVYLTQGMIQKALEEFRGALRLNPEDADLAQTIEQLETKLQGCATASESRAINAHRLSAQFGQNTIKDLRGDVYFVSLNNQRRAKTNRTLAAAQ